MTAVGAARPSAHGHAMTSVVMKNLNASKNGLVPAGSQESGITVRPTAIHTANETSAIATTAGTNRDDTLSANASMGAFDDCASST